MKKETILLIGAALIAGVLIGILFTQGVRKEPARSAARPPAAPMGTVDIQQNIKELERILAQQPDNRQAWVQLGNSYFDGNQPIKAIEAYDKALALDGNDPNVLTDQGVMFRQVGWYDRAIANFRRSQEISPGHPQSLYNLGVVYRYDLQDMAQARDAWRLYLQFHPDTQGADVIRRELSFLDAHPELPGGDMRPRQ